MESAARHWWWCWWQIDNNDVVYSLARHFSTGHSRRKSRAWTMRAPDIKCAFDAMGLAYDSDRTPFPSPFSPSSSPTCTLPFWANFWPCCMLLKTPLLPSDTSHIRSLYLGTPKCMACTSPWFSLAAAVVSTLRSTHTSNHLNLLLTSSAKQI